MGKTSWGVEQCSWGLKDGCNQMEEERARSFWYREQHSPRWGGCWKTDKNCGLRSGWKAGRARESKAWCQPRKALGSHNNDSSCHLLGSAGSRHHFSLSPYNTPNYRWGN